MISLSLYADYNNLDDFVLFARRFSFLSARVFILTTPDAAIYKAEERERERKKAGRLNEILHSVLLRSPRK